MDDYTETLWNAQRNAEAVGKVVTGLGVLCTRSEYLWLIVKDQSPDRIATKDISIGMGGIHIGGRLLVPFINVREYESNHGEPCVAFEMEGKEAIFAPADAPEDQCFIQVVDRFLKTAWFQDDMVYLSDLNGSVGSPTKDKPVNVRRHTQYIEAHPDTNVRIPEDELVVRGEIMTFGEITWAQRDEDGDGNRYLHIVMNDGRYRLISFGDLSR